MACPLVLSLAITVLKTLNACFPMPLSANMFESNCPTFIERKTIMITSRRTRLSLGPDIPSKSLGITALKVQLPLLHRYMGPKNQQSMIISTGPAVRSQSIRHCWMTSLFSYWPNLSKSPFLLVDSPQNQPCMPFQLSA